MSRKATGFTLVEVMASVSILSILLAVALPAFSALLEHQRAASAVAALVSHMSHARLAAVKHRRPTVLCPSTDGQTCLRGSDWSQGWIMFVDRDNTRRPAHASDVLQFDPQPRSRHLRIRSSAGRSYLRYMPDGRSAGSNLTINICDLDGTRLAAVVVNNAGRPRSERGPGRAPCPP